MATPDLVVPKIISLKNHPTLDERWLHDRLIENPSLLGLGELEVRGSERRQPSGGRLDLLLRNVEASTRYEVEIQLGAVDESHIIRTIEYWDMERRRYPQYDHVAVIVAEDVTSRFLNVISLLNYSGAIPLIAIQIKGVEVKGAFTLIATRVVDLTTRGTEEEDEGETVDRSYWERNVSKDSLQIMDRMVELINTVQQGMNPKYNKHHIGLVTGGMVRNIVTFVPRKKYVLTHFRVPQEEELTARLDETGLNIVSYDTAYGYYRVRVRQSDVDEHAGEFVELIRRAHNAYPTR